MIFRILEGCRPMLQHGPLAILLGISLLFSCDQCQAIEGVDIELLQAAWKIPAGGSHGSPYYSLNIEGIHLKGERPWEARWSLIKDAMDYQNKRILELGCNIGLTSVYLLKYGKALSALGVDRPDSDLVNFDMPRLMEAAKLTHQAFNVNVDILQINMNDSPYESIIGNNYDVVICMSFLKWIEDKERLLNYLSQFNHIIFEGHEDDSLEIERFSRYGFQYRILGRTQIGTSYSSAESRTLIYFFRDAE